MNKGFNLGLIPDRIDEVFEKLSSGGFICSNSIERDNRELYDILEDNLEVSSEYFSKIGFLIERGEGFFYFSKSHKASDEKKIERLYNYIDILDFLKSFNSNFVSGFTFTPSQVAEQCSVNLNLKEKLNEFKKDKSKNIVEKVRDILGELRRDGFMELVNPDEEIYKVLASFCYLENLLLSINIEDDTDEIA